MNLLHLNQIFLWLNQSHQINYDYSCSNCSHSCAIWFITMFTPKNDLKKWRYNCVFKP